VCSAVGFAAVFHGSDAKGVFVFMEAHAVVTDAQPELGRFNGSMFWRRFTSPSPVSR